MAEQNLILNIVTFSHPKEKQNFSFSAEKKEGFFPIVKNEFPLNINDIIGTEVTAFRIRTGIKAISFFDCSGRYFNNLSHGETTQFRFSTAEP
jgi:hypothetical protein